MTDGPEHRGRRGMIVTTSRLTRQARTLAMSAGINVIERADLADQMARLRCEAERRPSNPPATAPSPEAP